jgi:RNA polymerase sigma-70 factor (ECF subfamily)
VSASVREIERLYRNRYGRFRDGLAAVTGSYDSAHDVVQEAFARAVAGVDQFRGEGSLEGWVWRISLHLAMRERRNGNGRVVLDDVDGTVVRPEADPELAEALRALPPRRRLIVFLRYHADLSYEAIAEQCGISEGTVAASLAQAHAVLKPILERTRNG